MSYWHFLQGPAYPKHHRFAAKIPNTKDLTSAGHRCGSAYNLVAAQLAKRLLEVVDVDVFHIFSTSLCHA